MIEYKVLHILPETAVNMSCCNSSHSCHTNKIDEKDSEGNHEKNCCGDMCKCHANHIHLMPLLSANYQVKQYYNQIIYLHSDNFTSQNFHQKDIIRFLLQPPRFA
jgi:hypothetical protein